MQDHSEKDGALTRRDMFGAGLSLAGVVALAGCAQADTDGSASTAEDASTTPDPVSLAPTGSVQGEALEIEIIAEGLRFPEGPVAMNDGSVIVTEIEKGVITRILADGTSETVADLGGGPNDAKIGPDGALYVCNNGGFEWTEANGILLPGHIADDYETGRIERVDLETGEVTRLYDTVGEYGLRGPNSLVFDDRGGFYFSDHGKTYERQRDLTGIYYAQPDGSSIKELDFGHTSFNGVGLSPDGMTLYVADTMEGRLWAYDLYSPGEIKPAMPGLQAGRVIASMPRGWTLFDSLAVLESGKVAVATLVNGGITVIDPKDGTSVFHAVPDLLTTNIAFGGEDMRDAFVCLSGTGKVAKIRWPEPGLKLNFNA